MTPQQPCRVAAIVFVLALVLGVSANAQTPWSVPDPEKSRKSPIASSPKVVEQGKKVAQVNHSLYSWGRMQDVWLDK